MTDPSTPSADINAAPAVDHQALVRELRATHPDALFHLPDDGAPFLALNAARVDGMPAAVAWWRNEDGTEHSHHVVYDVSLLSERAEPAVDDSGAPVILTAEDGSQVPALRLVPSGAINTHEKAWRLLVEQVHAHFATGAPVSERAGPAPIDPRRHHALQRMLREHARIAIVGGAKTGKSTLAAVAEDRPVLHADDTVRMPWPEALAAIRADVAPNDRFVLEGVQAAKAIAEGIVIDAVLWLDKPRAEVTPAQVTQAAQVNATLETWVEGTPHVVVVRPDVPAKASTSATGA